MKLLLKLEEKKPKKKEKTHFQLKPETIEALNNNEGKRGDSMGDTGLEPVTSRV